MPGSRVRALIADESAGKLGFRIGFDKRAPATDSGTGRKPGKFQDQFVRWGNIEYLRGTEQPDADRAAGIIPAVITVRSDSRTRTIDNSWRARDLGSGATFNIRAAQPPNSALQMLIFMCDTGGVDG